MTRRTVAEHYSKPSILKEVQAHVRAYHKNFPREYIHRMNATGLLAESHPRDRARYARLLMQAGRISMHDAKPYIPKENESL